MANMDPVGPQKNIKSDQYHIAWQKLLDGGGAKENYEDGLKPGGPGKKTSKARDYDEWQGTVKGGTTHTYGVNGENDPD